MRESTEEIEKRMFEQGRKAILDNSTWFSEKDLLTSNKLDMYQRFLDKKLIFCIVDKGITLFPTYMFVNEQPLPVISQLINIFGDYNTMYLALWIEASNSYLGGVNPKSLLEYAPERVIKAAYNEVNLELHG